MLVNEGFGDIGDLGKLSFKKIGKAVKGFGKAVNAPVKALIRKPSSVFDIKGQWKMGVNMGKSLEKVAVAANPLDSSLKKLDEAGIKAGRKGNVVAKVFGRTGEKVRENPVATTAIVWAGVVAAGKLLASQAAGAGGSAAAGSGSSAVVGTGATGATGAGVTGAGVTGAGGAGGGLTAALTTAGEAVGTVGTAADLVKSVIPGRDGEEIDPFAADAEYAAMENAKSKSSPILAGMVTPQNALIFVGVSALSVAGYLWFNQKGK